MMTAAIAFVAFLNGFAIAVVLYRHYVMKPRWETESGLRKELKKVRADLYRAKHGRTIREEWTGILKDVRAFVVFNTKTPKVPHRSHSKVRFIPHPGDLLK